MRLESLRLQNFRGFEDATLPLDRPLTVLFGENGSGKSSVLRAMGLGFTSIIKNALDQVGEAYPFFKSSHDIRLGSAKADITIEWNHQKIIRQTTHFVRFGNPKHSFYGKVATVRSMVESGVPFLPIIFSAHRTIDDSENVLRSSGVPDTKRRTPGVLDDALNPGSFGFRTFFLWFKEREDAENRRKVQEKNFSAVDPHLSAVRAAIERLFPTYTNPRIQHDPLRLEITKGDQKLSMDQLSDGEKQVLVMTADIARRLSMVYPAETNPLEQEAVILVDEIELHLHPSWQRQILPAWRRIFPGSQFIVTTHSPQVISEVPNDAIFLVKNFQFVRPGAPTEGRDSNSILEESMSTSERPQDAKRALEKISALIDDEQYSEARNQLNEVAKRLTENDNEVVRLRTMLHFMAGAHATDSQG